VDQSTCSQAKTELVYLGTRNIASHAGPSMQNLMLVTHNAGLFSRDYTGIHCRTYMYQNMWWKKMKGKTVANKNHVSMLYYQSRAHIGCCLV